MKWVILDLKEARRSQIKSDLEAYGLTVATGEDSTKALLEWTGWKKLVPKKTLLVFPGNGAEFVRNHLPTDWLDAWPWATIYAKRFWTPGMDPVVSVGRIYERGLLLGITDLVLMDDMVSSGRTAQAIRRLNNPWVPNARWHAVAWVGQHSTNLPGFASYYFARIAGSAGKKAPIISLSTLLNNPEIARSFAERNLRDARSFLQLLGHAY